MQPETLPASLVLLQWNFDISVSNKTATSQVIFVCFQKKKEEEVYDSIIQTLLQPVILYGVKFAVLTRFDPD